MAATQKLRLQVHQQLEDFDIYLDNRDLTWPINSTPTHSVIELFDICFFEKITLFMPLFLRFMKILTGLVDGINIIAGEVKHVKIFIFVLFLVIQWTSLNAQGVVDDCHSDQNTQQIFENCDESGSYHSENDTEESQRRSQHENCNHYHSCYLHLFAYVQEFTRLMHFLVFNTFNDFQSCMKASPLIDGPFQPPRHS